MVRGQKRGRTYGRKKKAGIYKWLVIGFGICFLFLGLLWGKNREEKNGYSQNYVLAKELPSLLSFTYYDEKEWEKRLLPNLHERLTYEDMEYILKQTGTKEYISWEKKKASAVIDRQAFHDIYKQLLDLLDTEHSVKTEQSIILKTGKNLMTQNGPRIQNLPKGYLKKNSVYTLYVKDETVIGIAGECLDETVLEDVYVTGQEEQVVEFLFMNDRYKLAIKGLGQEVKDCVCDIVWKESNISTIRLKNDKIEGNLVAINDATIEIKEYGVINRKTRLPVYKTYGTVEEKSLSDIVLANMNVRYVVADGTVCAVLLIQPPEIRDIRVLLLNESGGIFRESLYLTCDGGYTVTNGEAESHEGAAAVRNLAELLPEAGGAGVVLKPDENAKLYVCNEKGETSTLGYEGTLEVRHYPEGFVLVNEVEMETYLCHVVPSEMPSSYEPAALMAQAICARSYAYIQLFHADYAQYGAHVDDSTAYQVYNKKEPEDSTTRAVKDTSGEVVTYQGNVIETYYFSTSGGYTNTGDVWGLDPAAYGYLKSGLVSQEGAGADLSDESSFAAYIKNPDAAACFDAFAPYFRWNARIDLAGSAENLQGLLSVRKQAAEQNITYLDKGQAKELETIEGFGNLTGVRTEKRSASGCLLSILMDFENGVVRVSGEYNIRCILGSGLKELNLQDGTKKNGGTLLPSAYFVLEGLEDGSFMVYGGGYGHGIGMSQNAAQGMAQAGKSYQEILNFFFQDIKIEQAPQKEG